MTDPRDRWTVPPSWAWVRLRDIADFSIGRTPPTRDPRFWADASGLAWAVISDMTHYGMLLETKRRVSEAARSDVFRGDPAPVGTLLMSLKLTIGKGARLGIPAYHNEAIAAIHPTIADLDPYLFRLLPLFAMGGATNAAIMGNTLNATSLGNIPIALPPLAEQQRLVARVDLILDLLSDLEASLIDMSHTNAQIAQAIAASVNT